MNDMTFQITEKQNFGWTGCTANSYKNIKDSVIFKLET